jgi:oligoribonuclease NrnB/cAMP/cGMP phosphodiesterase (DHH superfamily)
VTLNPSNPQETDFCLYHNDMDGRCAAAVVRRALGSEVRLHATDYGENLPWEIIENSHRVIVVDFSLPLDDMQRIREHADLIWIDHHKTSIEQLSSLEEVSGIRNIGEAACVLAWKYFFPDFPIPKAVQYVGDRDIWRFAHDQTKPFSEGLFQENTHPTNDQIWGPLMDGDQDLIRKLTDRGKILLAARLRRLKLSIRHHAFEISFEGHRALAINQRGNGDLGELIRRQGYEIGYCYYEEQQNDRLMTFVTLYSDQVDVSAIAAKFGGGGHEGAAGFSFERSGSPFPKNARVSLPNRT